MEMDMDESSNQDYGQGYNNHSNHNNHSNNNNNNNSKRKTALFQLFDWHHKFLGKKKLFPSKVPEPEVAEVDTTPEKAKHVGKKSKDEKLPMAKLLLIAEEENRGGFPAANRLSPKMESRLISKGDSPKRVGSNGGKRRPSVVARLMGLDTMPSPDPAGKESALQRKAMEVCPSRNPHRQSLLPSVENTHIPLEELKKKKQPKRPTTKDEYKEEEEEKGLIPYIDVGRPCLKVSVDDPAILFSKLPSLLPRNGSHYSPLRSILSPSKSHNRLASPIRSPLSAKKSAAIFIETAAAKILDPKMQPCSKNRSSNNASIRSSAVRHLLMGSSDAIEDHKSERKVSKNTTRALSRGGKTSSRFSSRQSTEKAGEKEEEFVGKTGSLGQKEGAEKALFSTVEKVEQPNQRRREQRQQQMTTSKPPPKREKAGRTSSSSTSENISVKEHRTIAKMGSSKTSDSLLQKWDQAKPRSSNSSSLARQDLSLATEPVRKQGGGSKISKGGRSNLPEITILAPSVEGIQDSSVLRTSSSNHGGILSYGRLFRSNRDGTHNKEEKEEIGSKKGGGGESSVMKSWLRRRASLESTDSIDKSAKDSKTRKNNNLSQLSSKSTSAQSKAPLPPPKVSDRLAPKKDTGIAKEEIEIAIGPVSNSNSSNNEKDLCTWANANDDSESTFKATSLPPLQSFEPSPVKVSEEDAKDVDEDDDSDDDDDDDDENDYCDEDDDNDCNKAESKKDEGLVPPGKTTAAILEELLTALNKSRLHFPFSENSRELTLLSERNADAFVETNQHPSSIPSHQPRDTIDHGIHSTIYEGRSPEDMLSNLSNNAPPDLKPEETDTVVTSLLMPERNGDLQHRICNEDEYVREIVSVPLLSFEDTLLFNELEERIGRSELFADPSGVGNGFNKASDQVSKQNRKLVFDCVLEVLKLGLGCSNDSSGNGDSMGWLKASSFSSLCPPKRDTHVLVQSVCKQIEEWRDMMNSVLLDDLVEKDRIFSGKWQSFDAEASELGLELECNIFGALIEDLVEDFAT